jgi:hypothetical protein
MVLPFRGYKKSGAAKSMIIGITVGYHWPKTFGNLKTCL